MPNEYGDYQTSLSLANKVTRLLNNDQISYTHVIEPTFGDGNFIRSVIANISSVTSISGFELQKEHYERAMNAIVVPKEMQMSLKCEDIFGGNVRSLFRNGEHNLVIGNLPWVTVSQLSSFESQNIPKKANINGLKGFDALTGKSNFDIAEYISLLLMHELENMEESSTIAVLVKNIVCENILRNLPNSNLYPSHFDVYNIDAKKEFGVSADASLMVVRFPGRLEPHGVDYVASVHSIENASVSTSRYGWVDSKFVSDVAKYQKYKLYDKETNWDWRSGIKHDAGKVMELVPDHNFWLNGFKEKVVIEDKLIYPLVKSSDVRKQKIHTSFRKYLLVPQKKMGEDTSYIKVKYPLTWQYLIEHSRQFSKRKSSIYKNKDQFSIFGIGYYSFKPYKVAISGMYKSPFLSVLIPKDGKPIMVDDTVYFVGFDNFQDAIIFAAVLNSSISQKLLGSLVFIDSKRPYTKDILRRIDVVGILKDLSLEELNRSSYRLISAQDVSNFIDKYSNVEALF